MSFKTVRLFVTNPTTSKVFKEGEPAPKVQGDTCLYLVEVNRDNRISRVVRKDGKSSLRWEEHGKQAMVEGVPFYIGQPISRVQAGGNQSVAKLLAAF